MDEFFWIIVFILFIVAPMLERVMKGGTRPPPGGQLPRRPGQQQQRMPPGQRPRLPDAAGAGSPQERTSTTAADVLPPELWELLTGQKPPARTSPPIPPPEESSWDEEGDRDELEATRTAQSLPAPVSNDEDRQVADLLRRRDREARQVQRYERVLPQVVSMERAPLSAAARHKQFHERLDRLKPAPAMQAPEPARSIVGDILRDGSSTDIRRAMIMQEILGTPKSLE